MKVLVVHDITNDSLRNKIEKCFYRLSHESGEERPRKSFVKKELGGKRQDRHISDLRQRFEVSLPYKA